MRTCREGSALGDDGYVEAPEHGAKHNATPVDSSFVADAHQLTPAAYERLAEELEDLRTRGRIEIALLIEKARELGDLSENGDYHAAKEEQGRMEGRIRKLEHTLADVEIIEGGGELVGPGSIVEIRYEGEDEVERYFIGSIEERHVDLDVLTPGSPLGTALVGAKAGDKVTFDTPAGASLSVEIVSVDH